MHRDDLKRLAAKAAIDFIEYNSIVGVGTGSTVEFFIEELALIKNRIEGAVVSSERTKNRLLSLGIPIIELNSIDDIPVYVDGADEINKNFQMIKGGGGALTGEKIVAAVAKKFICIADETKFVNLLGKFPVPIEVIPIARSYVARELVKLGGDPVYRDGFITDYGNIILDVHNFDIINPRSLEEALNQIAGVVTNGIFAKRSADVLIMGTENGVKISEKN